MIGSTSRTFYFLLAGAALANLAGAAPKSGPAVGARVPAFEAEDQTGKRQTLQSVIGPKGALLVFYRSADW